MYRVNSTVLRKYFIFFSLIPSIITKFFLKAFHEELRCSWPLKGSPCLWTLPYGRFLFWDLPWEANLPPDLLRDEFVTKQLETFIVVLVNWGKVLYAMDWPNNLRRTQGKTVVRPPSTAVLGSVCPKFFPHLTTLHSRALVSCESPRKVCVFLAFDGSFSACGQALNGYISFSSRVPSSWSPTSVYDRLVR